MLSNECLRLLLVISLLALGAVASAGELRCPEQIPVGEKALSIPRGWQTYVDDEPHVLYNMAFYSGHPRDRATLTPTSEQESGTTLRARWEFPRESKYVNWLACRYLNTNVTYVQPLPRRVSHCVVTYKKYPNTDVRDIASIVCELGGSAAP